MNIQFGCVFYELLLGKHGEYLMSEVSKFLIEEYDNTNHNSDAQYDFPAEDDIFRIMIPRKEIQDNNGIGETDNNKMPNI